ncbi:MAG TPA: hypothetical protein VFQ92_19060 [Blastocatellia bacterium]|nr:hypothetical protein [Blastocatellia bacterium]
MPLRYGFEDNLLHITGEDMFTFEELEQLFSAALADPRFVKGMRMLIDARDLRSNPKLEELRKRAELFASLKEHFTPGYALVVTDTLYYGLGRMFQVFAQTEGVEVKIFNDIDEARRYLAGDAEV